MRSERAHETPAPLTMDQEAALARIVAAGGSVTYGWSGWLGGVRGLRVDVVRQLVELGKLSASTEATTRRTARSRALPSTRTTYTVRQ